MTNTPLSTKSSPTRRSTPATAEDVFKAVTELENNIRSVKDWAYLVHKGLAPKAPLIGPEKEALARVAGALLSLGHKLDEDFDELWDLAKDATMR